MASGSHALALDEAADALGVSVTTLKRRIKAGKLPEAQKSDSGFFIAPEAIGDIAEREGWIVDLRDGTKPPSAEFTAMLEQLLGLGERLTAEVSARRLAEQAVEFANEKLATANDEIRHLHHVIEEQEAETSRIVVDLAAARSETAVAQALAEDRQQKIVNLDALAKLNQDRHERELRDHRGRTSQLRKQLDQTDAAMGWLSRRRLRRSQRT